MREVQDPKRDMMNTMNVIDASARAAGAVASAIGYYIETRALQDNNAISHLEGKYRVMWIVARSS